MTSNAPDDTIPKLNGLVLAGGKSSRMGRDKGSISWHGRQQRYHLLHLIAPYCENSFLSIREEQRSAIPDGYRVITDALEERGPYAAILSAFAHDPHAAWLVVACDLPLLDEATLAFLVQQRNPEYMATTFESPHDGLPEPLVTIWEPGSRDILLSLWEEGLRCPRKALLRNKVNIIKVPDPAVLKNVNTPEELEAVQALLLARQKPTKRPV
jgi:molybdopterin-guanine dinucleotide biosynthesis protein A